MEKKIIYRRFEAKSLPAEDGIEGRFGGIASTYGNVDLVDDIVEPGAFDTSIKTRGSKYPLLWQHDQGEPIGSMIVGTSQEGLLVEGKFNLDVQRGREGHALLSAGDISGLSIGYIPIEWWYDSEGIRHLKEVDLMEVSFVTFPANELAYAEAKCMAEKKKAAIRKTMLSKMQFLKKMTDEERTEAIDEIDEFLDETEEEDGKAEDEVPPKDGADEETEEEDVKEDGNGDILDLLTELRETLARLQEELAGAQ